MRVALHVTRHTSHVTRHTSHVTRHTSHVAGTSSSLSHPIPLFITKGVDASPERWRSTPSFRHHNNHKPVHYHPRCNDVCSSPCGRCCLMVSPTVIGCFSTAAVLQRAAPLPQPPEAALACTAPVVSLCMHPHVPHVIAALADGRCVVVINTTTSSSASPSSSTTRHHHRSRASITHHQRHCCPCRKRLHHRLPPHPPSDTPGVLRRLWLVIAPLLPPLYFCNILFSNAFLKYISIASSSLPPFIFVTPSSYTPCSSPPCTVSSLKRPLALPSLPCAFQATTPRQHSFARTGICV